VWQKTGGIAAEAGATRFDAHAEPRSETPLKSIATRRVERNLRHADAHDYRANDAMKVYKRCRRNVQFSTAILSHSTT
jgi:hypothetical protein